jgi:hypothetical protein
MIHLKRRNGSKKKASFLQNKVFIEDCVSRIQHESVFRLLCSFLTNKCTCLFFFTIRQSVKAALHPGAKYVQLKLVRLVGMMLIVYVKDHLRKLIKHETAEWCGTGLLGKMVINGATGISYFL